MNHLPKPIARIFGADADITDYASLPRHDSDAESQETLPVNEKSNHRIESFRPSSQSRAILPWQLATALLASLLAVVLLSWTARELNVRSMRLSPVEIPTMQAMHGGNIPYTFDARPDVYSPAAAATKWTPLVFHNGFHGDVTPWQGPPSDDVDRHWAEIYQGVGVIKITEEEAKQLPNHTLPIPDEDGAFIIGIEVYHQLHCLDLIRQALYPDRYGGDRHMSPAQKNEYWIHLEHCIDNLRQTLTCYSDISIIPWHIDERLNKEFPSAHTVHVCRDFDALTEWMLAPERHFPQEKYQARVDALRAQGFA